MLNQESLQEYIKKFQTSRANVVREYIQNLFLSYLYRQAGSDKLLFKGGTALRIIYASPRFSEDLDFTGQNIYRHEEIDALFLAVLSEIENYGIKITFKEAKPTSGGYLGLIRYDIFGEKADMKFEVSLRKGKKVAGEITSVQSDLTPPYTIVQIPAVELVGGKMDALLSRKKPRDYFDLYFMLHSSKLNKYVDKNRLKKVLNNLNTEKINFKSELMHLLPASYLRILKKFKDKIRGEIQMYVVSDKH